MTPLRVVVVGSGVAGLEGLLALDELAPGLVDVTLVAPRTAYRVRAIATREPFAGRASPSWSIPRLCHRHGARFVRGTVGAVDVAAHEVDLGGGRRLPYDALLLTTGATVGRAIAGGALFSDGEAEIERVHGLVQDVEEGWTRDVAFVVPPGATWPLPAYELALLLADRAAAMGLDGLRITLVTHERRPLALFGEATTAAVRRALLDRGIRLSTGARVASVEGTRVVSDDGASLAEAQRVVVLGRMRGNAPAGVPVDAHGFVPVGPDGAVDGAPDVWAAGDGTTEPVKLGAVAARRATAAAVAIARLAGATVPAEALVEDAPPSAVLLTGDGTLALGPSAGAEGPVLTAALAKVAAPRLQRALADVPPDLR